MTTLFIDPRFESDYDFIIGEFLMVILEALYLFKSQERIQSPFLQVETKLQHSNPCPPLGKLDSSTRSKYPRWRKPAGLS